MPEFRRPFQLGYFSVLWSMVALLILLVPETSVEADFYRILEDSTSYKILTKTTDLAASQVNYATLGHWEDAPGEVKRIITSPKSDNSDRIYMYTVKQPNQELVKEENKE